MNTLTKPRVFAALLVVYLIVSLPIVVLFFWNESCRNKLLNTAAHYSAKAQPIRTVHIGDSLTAGGGHWSLRIPGSRPFDSINLGVNGYTASQVAATVNAAKKYRPVAICVLVGTNDVADDRFDIKYTAKQYAKLLNSIADAKCIVTLVPYQSSTDYRERITLLNAKIRKLAEAHSCCIVDINPTIAPSGILLPEYTTDGTHLSNSAYRVWSRHISECLTSH